MNFKKLLDLFEAPVNLNYKGTAGTQAIQQATNQAKPGAVQNVNKIKPGQQLTLPGGGSYQVKPGDTMDRIARRNPVSTTPTVSTAPGPIATAPAPSTDNEKLKSTVAAGSPALKQPAPVAQADALSPGETIVDTPATDTRGAANLPTVRDVVKADKKEIDDQFTDPTPVAVPAPVAAAPAPPPYNDSAANAMASKSAAPVQVAAAPAPVAAAPTTIDSDDSPLRQKYGWVSEDDEELNELMRLSGRPVNEKAVSKQQQKFMGMVHAMQKGEKVKGASPELKKVAKTMSKRDAKDFASTKHQGLPKKVSESVMLEAGSTLEHIINKFKHETKKFINGEELDSDLYEALFDYYSDNGEIPYGVAKARDGDPRTWIEDRFENELDMMGYPRTHSELNYRGDNELTELARLAGLTTEDGPGASRLYTRDKSGMGVVPKDTPKDPGIGVAPKADSLKDPGMTFAPKERSLKDKMSANEGLSDVTDNVIDTAKGLANKGIDWHNKREQEKKDYWDSIKWADGSGGKPGASGATADLLPRFQTSADKEATRLANKDKAPSAISTPAAAKADAFGAALGAATAQAQTPPTQSKRVKENAELNQMRRIAGLTECGDMGMDSQQDSINVSTNMSSDGTKSVNISAQGNKADSLLQILKMAGMRPYDDHEHASMSEPEVIMVSSEPHSDMHDEMMHEEDMPGLSPEMERARQMQQTMTSDTPPEGDNLQMLKAWAEDSPQRRQDYYRIARFGDTGPNRNVFSNSIQKTLDVISNFPDMDQEELYNEFGLDQREADAIYAAYENVADELDQMGLDEERASDYANTPEEEYQTIDSIIRQGNDLNREKRQYADKPKLGDNPMAEAFTLDLDLDAMLESILIREEDSAAKKIGNAVKNPGNAAKDVGDSVKGRLTTTKDTDGKTSVQSSTGRIRATFDKDKPVKYEPAAPAAPEDNEKTNEGTWDDISNFVGDVVGTEASKLRQSSQLRDLDALRKQYKGTPHEKQVNDRYDTHLNRLQLDQGDVMDYDPKTGVERLKPVVPPDQWKGGK